MTKMTLPMAAMPAAISESVASVLKVYGLSLSPELLSEIGRNTTMALFAIDESLGAESEPEVVYEIDSGTARELRCAFVAHGLTDKPILNAIARLEQFAGTTTDVADLCHLAELAKLPWRAMFPDVFAAPSPSGAANEERDAAGSSPTTLPVASRSGCTPPATADMLAAGETLRSLAAQCRPNAHTAPALERVGQWLADTARAELAKGKAA